MPPEVVVPVLAAVVYYLGALAMVTRPLWRRYPPWLSRWACCPACAPTWYGGIIAYVLDVAFLGYRARTAGAIILAGAWCMFFVPLLSYVHAYALQRMQVELPPEPVPEEGDGNGKPK